MNRNAKIVLLILCSVAAGLVIGVVAMREGLIPGATSDAAETPARATVKSTMTDASVLVQTAPVALGRLSMPLEMLGSVERFPASGSSVSLASEVIVEAVLAKPGETVTAEMPVLRVSPSPSTRAALDQANAAVTAAQAVLDDAKARVDAGLGTRTEIVQAEQGLSAATVQRSSLQSAVPPESGLVMASGDGVLTGLSVTRGALVPAGTLMFEIAPADQVGVRFGVPLARVDSLPIGTTLSVSTLLSGGGERVDLSLDRLEPMVDPASRAVTAWTGPLTGGHWRSGTPVRLTAQIQSPPGLLVPRGAIVLSDDGPAVFTANGGVAKKHTVEMLAGDAQTVCVRCDTLSPGDAVVILGGHELEDGLAVRVEGGA